MPWTKRDVRTRAELENQLAISAWEPSRDESVAAYRADIIALAQLANTLIVKANPVVGDLLALVSALNVTTGDARSIIP